MEEALHTVHLYELGKHPDKLGVKIDTYFSKVNDYYIILRKEDDKIMKSYLYNKVIF
jgi:hypothetical protein